MLQLLQVVVDALAVDLTVLGVLTLDEVLRYFKGLFPHLHKPRAANVGVIPPFLCDESFLLVRQLF